MKGYCKCGKEIDEIEYTQFGMCEKCVDEEGCPECGYNWVEDELNKKNEYWRGYKQGYEDVLDDCKDGNWEEEPYRMEEDYD